MYMKLQITGKIEILTGMHIGGGTEFAAIGAIDSPVIRDTLSGQPIIPGSSLKGKIRTLLARQLNRNPFAKHNEDHELIQRLFGSQDKKSRLIFSDTIIENLDELRKYSLELPTEVKFENTISRTTAKAMPRQIERVVRGAVFPLNIIYQFVEADKNITDIDREIKEDIKTLAQGCKLLQYDYLGGHGSRGYGKIKFNEIEIDCVIGEIDDEIIDDCQKILYEVEI